MAISTAAVDYFVQIVNDSCNAEWIWQILSCTAISIGRYRATSRLACCNITLHRRTCYQIPEKAPIVEKWI